MRAFEFELTMFGGDRELVQVMGKSRAAGFAGAPLKAGDPNNVWKVRVVRDSGLYLVPEREKEEWNNPHIPFFVVPDTEVVVPNGELSPLGYGASDRQRDYRMEWTFFNGVCDAEIVGVSERPNAFVACAIDTEYPDSVMQVILFGVLDDRAIPIEVDIGKKYGAVTFDLKDPFVPIRFSH